MTNYREILIKLSLFATHIFLKTDNENSCVLLTNRAFRLQKLRFTYKSCV